MGTARLTVTQIELCGNFYGCGNAGDDLTLAAFLTRVAEHPGLELIAASDFLPPETMRGRFPQIRWLTQDELQFSRADVWALVGSTPFQLMSGPWFLDILERARSRCNAFGIPMAFLGAGVESREAVSDERALNVLRQADFIWTRDGESFACLTPYVHTSRLEHGADIANILFASVEMQAKPDADVALALAFERFDAFDLDELAAYIDARSPQSTRWLTQESRVFEYSERWIFDRLPASTRTRLRVNTPFTLGSDVTDFLSDFGDSGTVLSSRYHTALLAAWRGARIAILNRSAKLRGLAQQLGTPLVERFRTADELRAAESAAAAVSQERLYALLDQAERMISAFLQRYVPAPAADLGTNNR